MDTLVVFLGTIAASSIVIIARVAITAKHPVKR